MEVLSKEKVAALDREALGLLGVERLMESSGRAIAEAYVDSIGKKGVCVVCGPGNNGADGVAAARYLMNWGYQPRVVVVGEGNKNLKEQLKAYGEMPQKRIEGEAYIDALFGYNFRGEVRGEYEEAIRQMEGKAVLSVDVESGVEADGRKAKTHVNADVVVALCCLKKANVESKASLYLADIGIPKGVYEKYGLKAEEMFKGEGLIKIK